MEAYNNIAIVHRLILLHFVQCMFPRVVTSFKLSTIPGFLRAATEICSVVTTNLWEATEKPGNGKWDRDRNGKWELTQIAACCTGRNETIACKDLAHKDLQGWIRLHGDWYNSCKGCIIYFCWDGKSPAPITVVLKILHLLLRLMSSLLTTHMHYDYVHKCPHDHCLLTIRIYSFSG